MAVAIFLLTAILSLAYASYPFDSIFKKESVLVSKQPKQLLTCMAKCVDERVLIELEKCEKKYPISVSSAIQGGKKRSADFLVTMSKEELLYILNCFVQSRDPIAQRMFNRCSEKHPRQVHSSLFYCRRKLVGNVDNYFEAFIGHPELLVKMYECIRENTVELTHKEIQQQVSFENCAREAYTETCGIKSTILEE